MPNTVSKMTPDEMRAQGHKSDRECPWCRRYNLWRGPEVMFCPECPYSAQYHETLQDNPPYIIEAFAEWLAENDPRLDDVDG